MTPTPDPSSPHTPSRTRTRVLRLGLTAVVAAALAAPGPASGQAARPVPGPLQSPDFFQSAIANGTRTMTGLPGPDYWTHTAEYRIEAELDPEARAVQGTVLIRLENGSPRALESLHLHLHQNLHAAGVVRNEAQEVTGGVQLLRVALDGSALDALPSGSGPLDEGYRVNGQLMEIGLEEPLAPGGVVEVEVQWRSVLPQNGAGRMGYSRGETFFVAYWYPRLAVHDDLRGWDAQPYLGGAEFYDGFGDYDVSIRVPARWLVAATGELVNESEVFTPGTLERLSAAVTADSVVTIASPEELRDGSVTAAPREGLLEYRYRASRVRDFTFAAGSSFQWDATSAGVADRDGDGAPDRVAIHALWRPEVAPLWRDQARYASHAIEHHSRYTGIPYPWPHMTSVEGADIIGGGMEFPMLTLIGPYRDRRPQDLYNVTSHELAHMWVPMIVGTNEKRYAWMDEGLTTFLENESRYEYWPGTDAHAAERESYLAAARAGVEEPLMRHGDYYQAGGYGVASYAKPATLFVALRSLIGDAAFQEAYRGWLAAWAWRHPTPWDLFNAFEGAAGVELDWFWQSFFYETWAVDHAVEAVTEDARGTAIRIRDLGGAPMPTRVRVTLASGEVLVREIPVDAWLSGRDVAEIRIPAASGAVAAVELDPDQTLPDLDRSNDRWGG